MVILLPQPLAQSPTGRAASPAGTGVLRGPPARCEVACRRTDRAGRTCAPSQRHRTPPRGRTERSLSRSMPCRRSTPHPRNGRPRPRSFTEASPDRRPAEPRQCICRLDLTCVSVSVRCTAEAQKRSDRSPVPPRRARSLSLRRTGTAPERRSAERTEEPGAQKERRARFPYQAFRRRQDGQSTWRARWSEPQVEGLGYVRASLTRKFSGSRPEYFRDHSAPSHFARVFPSTPSASAVRPFCPAKRSSAQEA
jgi:hypothetical protein